MPVSVPVPDAVSGDGDGDGDDDGAHSSAAPTPSSPSTRAKLRRLVERSFLVVDMHSIYAPTQIQEPSSSSSSSSNGGGKSGGEVALLDASVDGGDLKQAAIFKSDLPLLFSLLKLPASADWWAECVRHVEGVLATTPVPVPDTEGESEGEDALETTLNMSALCGDADVLSYCDFKRLLRTLGCEVLCTTHHTPHTTHTPHTPHTSNSLHTHTPVSRNAHNCTDIHCH